MGGPGSGKPGKRKADVVCFRPTPGQLAHIDAARGPLSRGEYIRSLIIKQMR